VAGEGVIYVKVSPAGKMSERTDGFSLLTAPQPPEIARRSDDGHHIARVDVRGTQELVVTILKWRPGDSTPTVLEAFSITREAAP